MTTKRHLTCIRPTRTIRRLLREFLEGDLSRAGRERDRERIEQHIAGCAFCRQLCIEHAHQVVAVPFLKAVAKELGVPFGSFMTALSKTVQGQVMAGKYHRK